MRKKVSDCREILESFKTLAKDTKDSFLLYKYNWNRYQNYKCDETGLIKEFTLDFKPELSKLLICINKIINQMTKIQGQNISEIFYHNIDLLNDMQYDYQTDSDRNNEKFEEIKAQFAEHKFRYSELQKRDNINKNRIKSLEQEIENLRQTMSEYRRDDVENIHPEDQIQKRVKRTENSLIEKGRFHMRFTGLDRHNGKKKVSPTKNCEARVFRCFGNMDAQLTSGGTPVKLGNQHKESMSKQLSKNDQNVPQNIESKSSLGNLWFQNMSVYTEHD